MATIMKRPFRFWRKNRRPRLDPSVYGPSGYAVHITIGTYRSRPIFGRAKHLAQIVLSALKEAAAEQGVNLLCYCLMPDHLHLVAAAQEDRGNLTAFIRFFKTKVTWATKNMMMSRLWQRSFYDRVLRSDEALREVCLYVVNNPVRKGLVKDWRDYPYAWLSEEV